MDCSVFKSEQNFKIHLFLSIVILFGVFFGLTNLEWIAILLFFFGFICEVFNTAVEKLCDHFQL